MPSRIWQSFASIGQADGTGNAAACHVVLLASNNLTASRKGVPSLAWPVCIVYGEPTLSHNAPTSGSLLSLRAWIFTVHYARSVHKGATYGTVRTKSARVGNPRLKANHYERIRIRYLSLLRNATHDLCESRKANRNERI